MKYLRKLGLPALLFAGVLALGASPPGFAAGTASGTDVTNTATLSYSVGGVGQTDIPSNVTTFKVDNKIDLTVSEQGSGYTSVSPGQNGAVLTFRVQNTGNMVQDYSLSAANNPTDPFPPVDPENFDPTGTSVFVDVNDNDTYEPLVDLATYIDELAADAHIEVFVVANIPAGQTDGDIAAVTLTAQTAVGGSPGSPGADILSDDSGSADLPGTVQLVFADNAGDTDGSQDGRHSDTDAYLVASAQISVTKSSVVIRDPSNLGTNPKAIPGAWVQYTITIANAGTATQSATLTTISDALNANTAIDPDLIVGATGAPENAVGDGFKVTHASARPTTPATQYFTTVSDADGVEHAAGTVTATLATVLPVEAGYAAGELKPGESVSLIFNVVIQ